MHRNDSSQANVNDNGRVPQGEVHPCRYKTGQFLTNG